MAQAALFVALASGFPVIAAASWPEEESCASELAGRATPEGFLPEPSRVVRQLAHEAVILDWVQTRIFPAALRVRLLARGGESLVLSVLPAHGPEFVVRAPRGSDFARFREAYRREVRWLVAARGLDPEGAKHLAQTPALFEDSATGLPVLCMEQASLGPLSANLEHFGPESARRNPTRFLEAWRQMALAVRALHRIELVHRDVKPANFLWYGTLEAPHLRLSDLGIAAPLGSHVCGFEGLLSGTLSHMSMNQLECGQAALADDLYALRISFYEMLAGQSVWHLDPRRPENHIELRHIDEFGTYPVLTALPDPVASEVPAKLKAVADGTYGSINELLARIDALR